MSNEQSPEPHGFVRIYDGRGYTHLPQALRKELGIEGEDEIPYVAHTNCVLIFKKNTDLSKLIEGLDVLKEILKLRSKN